MNVGMSYTCEKIVEMADTAKSVDSGLAEVFATPSMIGLMESAAYRCVSESLDEGMSTVGTKIDVVHSAATPVGMKVWATATLKEIDNRRLVFDVVARDEVEQIGSAVHERFIINSEKFMSKVSQKGK